MTMRRLGSLPSFFLNFCLVACFVLIVYFVSFSVLVYNLPFYNFLFEQTGVKLSEAGIVTKELILYFKSSDASVPQISFFSASENSHMRDVKFVIELFFSFFYFLSAFFLAGFFFVRNKFKLLFYGSMAGFLLPLFLLLFSFGGSFTVFHQIFFPQGNWLFSPDALIVNIYTFEFFKLFALRILFVGEFIFAVVFAGLFLAKRCDGAD